MHIHTLGNRISCELLAELPCITAIFPIRKVVGLSIKGLRYSGGGYEISTQPLAPRARANGGCPALDSDERDAVPGQIARMGQGFPIFERR